MDFNLQYIPPHLHSRAIEELEAGDVIGFLMTAPDCAGLGVVWNNIRQLKMRGLYEAALLDAYTAASNNHHWSITSLGFLFKLADPGMLLAAGDRIPPGDEFTIYRGVSGKPRFRRVRSYSWTDDRSQAEWFATRCPLWPNPAVYSATIDRSEILAYTNDTGEREFIVRPRSCKRVELSQEAA